MALVQQMVLAAALVRAQPQRLVALAMPQVVVALMGQLPLSALA